jgi:hypothetical protein
MLEERLKETEKALKDERKRSNYETNQREEFINLYREAERKLGALRWLEDHMKDQAQSLDDWVRIKQAKAVKLQLTETPRMIIVALWVRNESVFPVTINLKDITGCLHFKTRPLRDPARTPSRSDPTEELEPRRNVEIILEQPILQSEAETILASSENGDPNAIFWLGNLKIPISVNNIPQPVETKSLRIHSEIEHMNITDFPCDNNP